MQIMNKREHDEYFTSYVLGLMNFEDPYGNYFIGASLESRMGIELPITKRMDVFFQGCRGY